MNEAMLLLGLAGNAQDIDGGAGGGLWSLGLGERHGDASALGCEGPFGGGDCDFDDFEPAAELRQALADFEDASAAALFAAALELDLELLAAEDECEFEGDEGECDLQYAAAHSSARRSATPPARLPHGGQHSHSRLDVAPNANARSFSASATNTRRHLAHRRTRARALAHSRSDTQLRHLPVLSQHPHVPTTFDAEEFVDLDDERENEESETEESEARGFSASHHVWVFLMAYTSSSRDTSSGVSGDENEPGGSEPNGSDSGGCGGNQNAAGAGDNGCHDDGAEGDAGDSGGCVGGNGGLGSGLSVSKIPLMFYDSIIAPVTAVMSSKLFGQRTAGAAPSDAAEYGADHGLLDHYDVFLEDELSQPDSLRKSHSSPVLRSLHVHRERGPDDIEIIEDQAGFDEVFILDQPQDEESSDAPVHPSDVAGVTLPTEFVTAPPESAAGVATPSAFVPPPNTVPTSYRLPKGVELLSAPRDMEHMNLLQVAGADSKCGAFIAEDDRTGENAAIVKVWNNECEGRDVGEPCAHREGVYVGDAIKKEVAAYRLDQLHFDGALGVPHTELALVPAAKFAERDRDRLCLTDSSFALCSYQRFVANAQGSENFNANSTFAVDAVHKVAVLDIMLANLDRNAPNVLVTRRKALVPIDHGLTLPGFRHLEELSFEWLLWKQSKAPISPALRDQILAIDTVKGVAELERLSVPTESILTYLLCVAFLKEGVAAGASLYDIGNAMARDIADEAGAPAPFEALVGEATFSTLHVELPADQATLVDGFRARARAFFGARASATMTKSAL